MSLLPGTRLGPYEVLAPLGAGGMGEVYRARDTKLGRDVAVKVLPDAFAQDAERLARFEREARVLASLNHPNVAAIYGLEESEGVRFLVLELVEGETLDERLAAGPLPIEEALRLARQIAEALEAAHEKAIVHRDLKPGNIKVTPDGKVKVLDFGIAKTFGADPSTADASRSPTLTSTQAGTVLGTPAYMSPEQARGRPVDKRTDIWSFGCVLYEMLTGRKAFGGATVSDTLAAILAREPDWSAVPSSAPREVHQLLHRCLEKDANRRLRDAGDARLEIEEAVTRSASPVRRVGGRGVWLGGIVLVGIAGLLLLFALRHRSGSGTGSISQPKLSQVTFAEGIEQFPTWSPDGSQLLYAAEAGGMRQIFVKRLATGEERRLMSDSFDDIQPAWAPDGRTILFVRSRQAGKKLEPGDVFGQYDGGDLWALDVRTGKETKLLDNAFNPAFSPDGQRIALDSSWAGPRRIWVVNSVGSNPQQMTSDVSEAVVHVRPRWSPDGTRIVFQNIERTKFDIRVVDTSTKKLTWVTNDLARDLNPVWSSSGQFVYFSSDRGGGLNVWRIAVASEGSPASLPQQLTTGAGQDVEIAVSSDGKRLAFAILKQNADLWELPVSPETGLPEGPPREVIATTREDSRGAWSPDQNSIAFNSDRTGEMNIWLYFLKDSSTRQLTRGSGGDFQPNWSPDGKRIAFFTSRSGNADIWAVDVGSGQLRQLTKSPSIDVNPFYSPDGSRIAYQSDQSGRLEVWVMGAEGAAPKQLTRVGVSGHFLRWTRDGRSILFRCPCSGKSQSLLVDVEGGEPVPVAEITGGAHMSFSPDGSRVMDVLAHKVLWVSPLRSGAPEKVFEFDDSDSRIDYPVWSPDGRRVLFDRFRPQGGDIWMMEGFE